MGNDKTEKFFLLGITKEMRTGFNAVNMRSILLSAFISIPKILNFQDFSHNI